MIQFCRNHFLTDFLCLSCLRFLRLFIFVNMNRLQYVVVTLSVWLIVVSAVPLGILPDVQNAAPSPGMYDFTLFFRNTFYINVSKCIRFIFLSLNFSVRNLKFSHHSNDNPCNPSLIYEF